MRIILHGVRRLAHAILGQLSLVSGLFLLISGLVLKRRDRDTGSDRGLVLPGRSRCWINESGKGFHTPDARRIPAAGPKVLSPHPLAGSPDRDQPKRPILSGFLSNLTRFFKRAFSPFMKRKSIEDRPHIRTIYITRECYGIIHIGDTVELSVREINEHAVRLSIIAPREIPIFRGEIYRKLRKTD